MKVIFILLKFISIFFVPSVVWYQRLLLFSVFFMLCFIEEKTLRKNKKWDKVYLSTSIIFLIAGMLTAYLMQRV